MNTPSLDQQALAAIAVYQVKEAIDARDFDKFQEVIPCSIDDDDKSVWTMCLMGALKAAMHNDLDGFIWAMSQMSFHGGFDDFLPKFWIFCAWVQGQESKV